MKKRRLTAALLCAVLAASTVLSGCGGKKRVKEGGAAGRTAGDGKHQKPCPGKYEEQKTQYDDLSRCYMFIFPEGQAVPPRSMPRSKVPPGFLTPS